jgi:hypothetical protein
MNRRAGSRLSYPSRTKMTSRKPKYSKEEHARRGNDMYLTRVSAQVSAGNEGKVVALDIDTGVYELADNSLQAAKKLLARYPDAQVWCVRIGYPAVHRFGPRAKVV